MGVALLSACTVIRPENGLRRDFQDWEDAIQY